MTRQDKEVIKNLKKDTNSRKLFKRQKRLDSRSTVAEIQKNKAKGYLLTYLFAVIWIILSIVLYKYYMEPYWNNFYQSIKDNTDSSQSWTKNINTGWKTFLHFFAVGSSPGAVADIIFIILAIIFISIIIEGCIYWLIRFIKNIFDFGRSWFIWLMLSLFAWIPVVNIFTIIIAIIKYRKYINLSIVNEIELNNSQSDLNNENK